MTKDEILDYESAKDYINNSLPKGFPYKMNYGFLPFLKVYNTFGYHSKYYEKGKLVNSKFGKYFSKSDLDSFIADALKPVEIINPKNQLVRTADVTIDYICSCILVSEFAESNHNGLEPKSLAKRLVQKFPAIKLGLPFENQKATWLIHKSYLEPTSRKVISFDEFKNSIIKIINHPSINNIINYTPCDLVSKLNTIGIKDLYKIDGKTYIFYGDKFEELKKKFLDSITIYNCESSILDKDDIISKKDINLDKLYEFISPDKARKILIEIGLTKSQIDTFFKKMSFIKIPFFNSQFRYVKSSSILALRTQLLKDLSNVEDYHTNAYWCEKMGEYLPKFMHEKSFSIQAFRRALKTHDIKSQKSGLLSQDEFNELIQGYYSEIEVLNVDGDLASFNIYQLNKVFLDEYVSAKYLDNLVELSKGMSTKILQRAKFPCIKWRGYYYYKRELILKYAYYRNNRVTVFSLSKEFSDKYNFSITKWRIIDIANSKNIKVYEETGDESVSSRYILKDDVEIIEKEIIEEYERLNFTSIANYMYKYIERNPQLNEIRLLNTLDYFKKYIIKVNNNVRVIEASKRKMSPFRYIYRIISSFDKEIYDYTRDEINDLLDTIEYEETQETVVEFTSFYNYVMRQRREFSRVLLTESKEKKTVSPYTLEEYFSLLAKILKLINDKKFVINKLCENRYLSSSILYIFSHYIACWRNITIVNQLPNANLSLIGFDDGSKFIDWYKCPDSVFTEKMGELICTDIENKVIRVGKVASKNGGKLLIYISKFLYKYYGLLLSICEANRCLDNKRMKDNKSIDSVFSSVNFSSNSAADFLNRYYPDLLSDFDGKFSNRKANKSFETFISDKSEEWNLGIGYLMAAVARGHKIDAHVISETTKIYIDKEIDSTCFEVFSNKVFSGVKYKFMDIIYDDFSEKSKEEKLTLMKSNEITNLQVEEILKSLAIKKDEIDKFFNKYLSSKSKKRETLREVIHGKNCYAKHENTKCLLRAYNSTNLEEFIYSDTSASNGCILPNRKDCIGCPFLIAEKYFLFELSYRLKDALNTLNNCSSEMDKLIHINRIKSLFFPIIFEAISELGDELVNEIIDIQGMLKIYEDNKRLISVN